MGFCILKQWAYGPRYVKPIIVNQVGYEMETGFMQGLMGALVSKRGSGILLPFWFWVPKTNLPTRKRVFYCNIVVRLAEHFSPSKCPICTCPHFSGIPQLANSIDMASLFCFPTVRKFRVLLGFLCKEGPTIQGSIGFWV